MNNSKLHSVIFAIRSYDYRRLAAQGYPSFRKFNQVGSLRGRRHPRVVKRISVLVGGWLHMKVLWKVRFVFFLSENSSWECLWVSQKKPWILNKPEKRQVVILCHEHFTICNLGISTFLFFFNWLSPLKRVTLKIFNNFCKTYERMFF